MNCDGPAFPVESHDNYEFGCSKRELFAAMALQGLLAASNLSNLSGEKLIAESAVCYADALLAKLGKEPQ